MDMEIGYAEETVGMLWMAIAAVTFIGMAARVRTNPSASVGRLLFAGSVGAALATVEVNLRSPSSSLPSILASSALIGAVVYATLSVALVLSREFAGRQPRLSSGRYALMAGLSAVCGTVTVMVLLVGVALIAGTFAQ